MARVLYTAEATVTGGRASGHGRTNDGALDVQLRLPKEMGGEGGGTNPEQLFAVGYAVEHVRKAPRHIGCGHSDHLVRLSDKSDSDTFMDHRGGRFLCQCSLRRYRQ